MSRRNVMWVLWGLLAVLLIIGLVAPPFPNASPANASAGWLSADLFSAGVLSAGLFSVGVFSAGLFSAGIVSVGVFSVGIVSVGSFALGIWAVGHMVHSWRQPRD